MDYKQMWNEVRGELYTVLRNAINTGAVDSDTNSAFAHVLAYMLWKEGHADVRNLPIEDIVAAIAPAPTESEAPDA